jgi:hypothetical protein
MALAPPLPAQPGQPYFLYFSFLDFQSGSPVDPASLQLDITYGLEAGIAPDVAGTFTYAGASAEATNTIWRTGTGEYTFMWDVPTSGILPGVYIATWTSIYGSNNDEFQALENFPVTGGGPFVSVPAGDTGFWTGSLSYQPSWAPGPFTIPFGAVDGNGVAWILEKVDGWDGPPSVGQVIQRSADHGGWPSAQFYGPRLLTLTVMASAPTQAARDVAKEQLVQAVPVSDLATFTYNEPVPKQAYVRQNASANIGMKFPTLVDVVFTIPLVAPDPRKYSTVPLVQTSTLPAPVINPLTLPVTLPAGFPGSVPPIDSAVTCVNSGTFETRPVITVSGPIINPSIVNAVTGQAITFTGLTLAATDQLIISTDARQAFLNGTFAPADVDSAWWVLTPGSTQVFLTGDNFAGGATINVAWSSAWA